MKMSKFMPRRMAIGALAAIAALASVGAAFADEITGAGATFPQPVYTRWAEQYAGQGGDTLNYQGIGQARAQPRLSTEQSISGPPTHRLRRNAWPASTSCNFQPS